MVRQVVCQKCHAVISSSGETEDEIWSKLIVEINNHYSRRHPKSYARIRNDVAELSLAVEAYVRLSEMVEESDNVVEQLDSLAEGICECLGIEVAEEEEEEELAEKPEEIPATLSNESTES